MGCGTTLALGLRTTLRGCSGVGTRLRRALLHLSAAGLTQRAERTQDQPAREGGAVEPRHQSDKIVARNQALVGDGLAVDIPGASGRLRRGLGLGCRGHPKCN